MSQNNSRDHSKDKESTYDKTRFLSKGPKKSRRNVKSHNYESGPNAPACNKKSGKQIHRRSVTNGSKKNKTNVSHDRSSSVNKDNINMANNCSTSVNSNKLNKKYQNFTEELVHMLNLKINKKKAKNKS